MHRELPRAVIFACALAALPLPGCQGPSGSAAEAARSRATVVNGEPSPLGGAEDAVLLLRTSADGSELVCSASLVAPNLVLTARHCVSRLVRGLFRCTVAGELESEDPGAGTLGTHLPVEELEFFDGRTPRSEPIAYGKSVLSTLSETICVNDVALVELDRSLELPLLPLRLDGRARRGERVTLVGYGLDAEMSETGELDVETQLRTRNDRLEIADVGPLQSDGGVLSAPPRAIVVEGVSGCFGDSGGPLLARDTRAVLGVYSLFAGTSCVAAGGRHLFAHVPDFGALLDDAFELAGAEPIPEPEAPASGGAAGQDGAEAGAAGAGAAGGEGGLPGSGAGGEAGAPSTGGAGQAGASDPGAGMTSGAVAPRKRDSGCALGSAASSRADSCPWFLCVLAMLRVRYARRRQRRSSSGSSVSSSSTALATGLGTG